MDALINKVRTVLTGAFAGAETELEVPPSGGKVGGFLIWDGFAGKEQLARQTEVWRVLRQNLTRSEQLSVSAVLTMTPEEMAAAREG